MSAAINATVNNRFWKLRDLPWTCSKRLIAQWNTSPNGCRLLLFFLTNRYPVTRHFLHVYVNEYYSEVFLLLFQSCDDVDSVIVRVTLSGDEGTSREIANSCGVKRPPMLMSSSTRMDLDFLSGPSSGLTSRGFAAVYAFVSGKFPRHW